MIRHLVMWKLNEGIDNPRGLQIAEKIKKDFENLKEQLDCVEKIELHLNDKDSPQGNHDIVLVSEFQNHELMQQYLKSPEHEAIAVYLKQHTSGRTAIDYKI